MRRPTGKTCVQGAQALGYYTIAGFYPFWQYFRRFHWLLNLADQSHTRIWWRRGHGARGGPCNTWTPIHNLLNFLVPIQTQITTIQKQSTRWSTSSCHGAPNTGLWLTTRSSDIFATNSWKNPSVAPINHGTTGKESRGLLYCGVEPPNGPRSCFAVKSYIVIHRQLFDTLVYHIQGFGDQRFVTRTERLA